MDVLVIGGTRFLGLSIVRSLSAYGHHAIVAHRGLTTARLPEDVQECHLDVRDRKDLKECLEYQPFDAVIDTILNVADLEYIVPLVRRKAKRFIHCGSTGVYTPMKRIPAHENDTCEPHPELGGFEQKLRQDRYLLDEYRENGFPATILRPTNIYGPGDIPLDIWGGRSSGFFRRLLRHELVTLPNDGRSLLQPGYVSELGEAFVQALEAPEAIGQVYNISSAQAVTLREYLATIREALSSRSPVVYAPMESILERFLPSRHVNESGLRFVCEHMCVDINKARRELGYMPLMSLEEGMARNLRWMREAGHLPPAGI